VGAGGPGGGYARGGGGGGGVSGLSGGGLGFRDGLQKRGRQNGRGEGEKVEADEESFVESAADEQDGLSEGKISLAGKSSLSLWLTLLW
jgi:hypothetical protein